MATLIINRHGSITSDRPEHIVLAMIATHGAGFDFPPPGLVGWLGAYVPEYDNTIEYWQPYERAGADWALKVWVRGAWGQLRAAWGDRVPPIEQVDPAAWHSRLPELKGHLIDGDLAAALSVAMEQTSPDDLVWGEQVRQMHEDVRRSAITGKLLVDPAKIRRRAKAAQRSDFAPSADERY